MTLSFLTKINIGGECFFIFIFNNYFMKDAFWYYSLNKSPLTPPNWVFPVIWTILYLMIALSFLFYIKGGFNKDKVIPFIIFIIQLALNFSWAPVYFGKHNILLAFWIIIFLIVFVFVNIILFYKKSKIAAYLLIPYFIWIVFAAYLNFEIVMLN